MSRRSESGIVDDVRHLENIDIIDRIVNLFNNSK